MNKINYLFLISFVFTLSLKEVAAEHISPKEFFPKDLGFTIERGPKNEIYFKSYSCSKMLEIGNGFVDWKSKVDGNIPSELPSCTCGKSNDKKMIKFFFDREVKKNNINFWQLRKKNRLKKSIKNQCYLNVDRIMPKRFKELALRQMAIDNDYFKSSPFFIDGVNCYNTALYVNGIINSERYIDDIEIDNFLNPPLCIPFTENSKLRAGDIIAYYEKKNLGSLTLDYGSSKKVTLDDLGFPSHTATYVSKGIVFDKKGGRSGTPFQLGPKKYTDDVYMSGRDDYYQVNYRCLSPESLKSKLKEFPGIEKIWNDVEEVEDCYKDLYLKDSLQVDRNIQKLRESVLLVLSGLIDQEIRKRKKLDEQFGFYIDKEGYEDELVILGILRSRVNTMIQDKSGRHF